MRLPSRRTRRLVPAAVPLLLVAAVLGSGATAAPDGERRLAPGGSTFWDADDVAEGSGAGSDCGDGCQDFPIVLTGAGARLRVAIDTDGYGRPSLQVLGPGGEVVAEGSGTYSAEVFVRGPAAGRYVVRVPARAGTAARLRARLERRIPAVARGGRALLPNLRLVPPYAFTMDEATATGRDVLGCNAYEKAEYGARHCLRFSLGPANTGDGPFMLRFPAMSGIAAPEPVYQLIQHADGTVTERQAGSALYHKTHAHHHHNGFGSLELFRVTDPSKGRMVLAGTGPKQGFCMLDFLIADWRSFENDPSGSVRQDCSPASGPTSTQLGLSRGWADIYTYGLDGNYVEFGDNPDGRYVVRSVADASDDVLETDETDNAGYAYIEVEGSTVTVIERGHGLSPWDPRKQPADDLMPSNP